MNNDELRAVLEEFETERDIDRPDTKLNDIEQDAIPTIIDIGYYTSPKYWGKNSDSDNETLQFMINMATFEANNISISATGTIFQRWNIQPGQAGYITPEARRHIRRAICLITDIFENSDYDRTKGSYSFSLPGMSVSQSTSDNNLVIPQTAINELIAAGFHLAPYSTEPTTNKEPIITDPDTDFNRPGNEELYRPISRSEGDDRYLRRYQPNAIIGTIPQVNSRYMLEFNKIEDIIASAVEFIANKANMIYDPETGTYKQINQFSVEYFGGWTVKQITNAIVASNTRYNSTFNYTIGFIILDIRPDGTFGWYESIKEPNIGHPPATSPEYWKELPTAPIDINAIVEQLKPHIQIEVKTEVIKQVNALPTIDYSEETANQLMYFNDYNDWEKYMQETQTDDSYFDNKVKYSFVDSIITNYNQLNYEKIDFKLNSINTIKENRDFIGSYLKLSYIPGINFIDQDNSGKLILESKITVNGSVQYPGNGNFSIELGRAHNIITQETWTGNYLNGSKIYVKEYDIGNRTGDIYEEWFNNIELIEFKPRSDKLILLNFTDNYRIGWYSTLSNPNKAHFYVANNWGGNMKIIMYYTKKGE